MPKVIVTPSPIFSPIGVRLLLGEIGVLGPMLQDETTITCMMTEAQIERFRNGRGAAHKLEIVPDSPPPVVFVGTPEDIAQFEQELAKEEAATPPEKAPEKAPEPPAPPPSKGPKKVA